MTSRQKGPLEILLLTGFMTVSACVGADQSGAVGGGSHTFTPSGPCIASAGCSPDQQEITVDAGSLTIDGGEIQDGWIVPLTQSISVPRAAWIANTDQGTVSKIDIDLRREIARYPSVLNVGEPGGGVGVLPWDYSPVCSGALQLGNCPSRTAVDQQYNAYVANRGFAAQGSVTKFQHDTATCTDRDGDGVIRTSYDANGDGSIDISDPVEFPGQADDCVRWTTSVGAPGVVLRSIVVTIPDGGAETGDLWLPYYAIGNQYGVTQVDTDTGAIIADHGLNALAPYYLSEGKRGFSSYGASTGIRDARSRIWMIRRRWPSLDFQLPPYTSEVGPEHLLAAIDPTTGVAELPPVGIDQSGPEHEGYGITSGADGAIWFSTKGTTLVNRQDTPGRLIAYYPVATSEHAAGTIIEYPMPPIETGVDGTEYSSQSSHNATCREKPSDPDVWQCYHVSTPLPTTWRTWMPEPAGLAASQTDIWIALRELSGHAPPLPAGQSEEKGGRAIARFNLTTKRFTYYLVPWGSPTGIGVGPDGLIWAVQMSGALSDGRVMAFDPDTEDWVTMAGGALFSTTAGPGTYTYSDFIGFGVNELVGNATVQFVIDGCGEDLNTTWNTLSFDSDIPAGASMEFYFRTAGSVSEFSGPTPPEWQGPFTSTSPIDLGLAPGPLAPLQHLQVRVEMQSGETAPPRIRELAAGTLCAPLE